MPLFECEHCHCVDNTALGNFWWDVMHDGKPALCVECDPTIGEWHGLFPKISMAEYVGRFGRKAVQYPAGFKSAPPEGR